MIHHLPEVHSLHERLRRVLTKNRLGMFQYKKVDLYADVDLRHSFLIVFDYFISYLIYW